MHSPSFSLVPTSKAPAVTIVLAVRNGGVFLDEALSSLAVQSFGDFEVVVVDNGSTDGSDRVIGGWVERDQRFRSFRFSQPGLARSLNYGASHARGDLLARLDADDIALPDRLEVQHAIMRKRPELGLLGSQADLIDATGRIIGKRRHPVTDVAVREYLRHACGLTHSTVMMRRDLFETVGGYREGLKITEDYDLWCRLAEIAPVTNVDKVLVRYRVHTESMSLRLPLRMAIAHTCVIAAGEARSLATAEPFIAGRPSLRRALPLLNVSRAAYRRQIYKKVMRTTIYARYYSLPLPDALKRGVHAVARKTGVTVTYHLLLAFRAATKEWRKSNAERRPRARDLARAARALGIVGKTTAD